MSFGLITYKPDGEVSLDLSSNVAQVYGSVLSGTGPGSVPIELPSTGTPFYVISRVGGGRTARLPGVTLTRTTLSWNFKFTSGYAQNCNIYYGTY